MDKADYIILSIAYLLGGINYLHHAEVQRSIIEGLVNMEETRLLKMVLIVLLCFCAWPLLATISILVSYTANFIKVAKLVELLNE